MKGKEKRAGICLYREGRVAGKRWRFATGDFLMGSGGKVAISLMTSIIISCFDEDVIMLMSKSRYLKGQLVGLWA